MNYWTQSPENIYVAGHRGWPDQYPENTMESFRAALALGIDQLEFDGFSYNEAVYAADACGADWYQQAALRARSYLDIMSFSRQGLIDQLEFDGFPYDQAVYGVDKVY